MPQDIVKGGSKLATILDRGRFDDLAAAIRGARNAGSAGMSGRTIANSSRA